MISVKVDIQSAVKTVFQSDVPLSMTDIWNYLESETALSRDNFYAVHNGRLIYENEICSHGCTILVPRLLGGKGGFGSMLRAIGAQIEKTTNREACRDLSGRRLRDINEEKRLKAWIEKQSNREEEAAERKKKKLERLCAEPKHEFEDQNYEKERTVLTERIGDAVEQGFKAAVAGSSCSIKRKHTENFKPNKRKTLLDLDIDSDELTSSDDSDEDEAKSKKSKVTNKNTSNTDSGHSSDETEKASKNSTCPDSEHSELSCDTQITDKEFDATKASHKDTENESSTFIPPAEKCIEKLENA